MPRVNRDLQRRMAARRERERRRPPSERRYEFGVPEAPVESEDLTNGVDLDEAATNELATRPARRTNDRATVTAAAAASARGAPRAHMPFTAYAAEYAYVGRDLRRVALVIGSLLLILIVLYFVLPH